MEPSKHRPQTSPADWPTFGGLGHSVIKLICPWVRKWAADWPQWPLW